MSKEVLEKKQLEGESGFCDCCLKETIEIVLGTDDDGGIVEKVGNLYLELYGEPNTYLGVLEKVRFLELEQIELVEKMNLLETKLKRLEN